MDVVILGAGRPLRGEAPAALKPLTLRQRALDWQLSSLSTLPHSRIRYVAGYGAEAVMAQYPRLDVLIAPEWASEGVLDSLLHAELPDGPVLAVYADTVFHRRALHLLNAADGDVVYGYDSGWRDRFPRQADGMVAEPAPIHGAAAQFTGLIRLGARAVALLKTLDRPALGRTLLDLLAALGRAGLTVTPVDLAGEWAEFDDPRDVARFVLGTKAQTLDRLRSQLTHGRIGAQSTFTVGEWREDPARVAATVRTELARAARLIVRSSSALEDGWTASNAGRFVSIADVAPDDEAGLAAAIDAVVASYGPRSSDGCQVLVQEQVTDVASAGVVLTAGLDTGGPYWRFSVDDRGSTAGVTAGADTALRTVVIARDHPERLADLAPDLVPVLTAVREIEEILCFDRLDIEFAIDAAGVVHIFQVRPITVDHAAYEHDGPALRATMDAARAAFCGAQGAGDGLVGDGTVFANMPDWNPAEIIGVRPRALALSMYRSLVTDGIWAKQRAGFGYRDVRPAPLLHTMCGQPYIDVRASLNSFVPASVPADGATRIVNAGLDRLRAHPELQDKLEFAVAFTAWEPTFRAVARERYAGTAVTDDDVAALEAGLKAITRAALTRLDTDLAPLAGLDDAVAAVDRAEVEPAARIAALIGLCARSGTLPFAHAARAGFVAMTLLDGLCRTNVFTPARRAEFLASIDTVAGRFQRDRAAWAEGRLSLDAMLARYGHLRPGTYDVTIDAYREDPPRYFGGTAGAPPGPSTPFVLTGTENEAIARMLAVLGSDLSPDALVAYLRRATEAREDAKFRFSRPLSRILDLCAEAGAACGLDRTAVADIPWQVIAEAGPAGLVDAARAGRVAHRHTQLIELPPVLTQPDDIYGFVQPAAQPNFITGERGRGMVILADAAGVETDEPFIAVAERADPGYDWLFSRRLAGLVTKYGGANSHMAIRAAELRIPAVIGVGEELYARLAAAPALEIDCANRIVRPLP